MAGRSPFVNRVSGVMDGAHLVGPVFASSSRAQALSVEAALISEADLIANKNASARPQDLVDVQVLEEQQRKESEGIGKNSMLLIAELIATVDRHVPIGGDGHARQLGPQHRIMACGPGPGAMTWRKSGVQVPHGPRRSAGGGPYRVCLRRTSPAGTPSAQQ